VETVTGGVSIGEHEWLAACTVRELVYRIESFEEEVRYSDGMSGRAVAAVGTSTCGVAHV